MKRRTHQSRKLRDRRTGQSPYARYKKRPYAYGKKPGGREARTPLGQTLTL